MEDRVLLGLLLDTYRPCLPEKQQRILSLFMEEDCSLAEIAEMEHVSRQAVHESLKRGEEELHRLEDALHLLAKSRELSRLTEEALIHVPENAPELSVLLTEIQQLLEDEPHGI